MLTREGQGWSSAVRDEGMLTNGHSFSKSPGLASPRAELEAGVWVRVVYVGSTARSTGRVGNEMGRAEPGESVLMNQSQLWASGPSH